MKNEIISYKAFDRNLRCYNNFQYEIGKSYSIDGEIKCCKHGFHACPEPAGVFNYYDIFTSRFALVKQSGIFDGWDGKICSSKIAIIKELSLKELIEHEIKWVINQFKPKDHSTIIDNLKLLLSTNLNILITDTSPAKITYYDCTVCSVIDNVCLDVLANGTNIYLSGNNNTISLVGSESTIFSLGTNTHINLEGNYEQIVIFGNNSTVNLSGYGSYVDIKGNNCKISLSEKFCYFRATLGTIVFYFNHKECQYSRIVDGKLLKPNIKYMVRDGKFIEIDD